MNPQDSKVEQVLGGSFNGIPWLKENVLVSRVWTNHKSPDTPTQQTNLVIVRGVVPIVRERVPSTGWRFEEDDISHFIPTVRIASKGLSIMVDLIVQRKGINSWVEF